MQNSSTFRPARFRSVLSDFLNAKTRKWCQQVQMAAIETERKPYRYTSISDQPDAFRLFKILSESNENGICGSIITTNLTTEPSYKAISYTWGAQALAVEITCDEQVLHITSNLAEALQQLNQNLAGEECLLYADAICIDQQNVQERGHQVGLMADIYQSASEVLIWLGPDSAGTASVAFDMIARYAICCRDAFEKVQDWARIPRLYPDGPFPVTQTDLKAIADIFRREWFKRVWVLQEVGLARRATLVCGSSTLKFSYLVTFAHAVQYNATDLGAGFRSYPVHSADGNIWSTFQISGTWREEMLIPNSRKEKYPRGLVDVLNTTLYLRTTDPRDYVYAMLGHPVMRDQETQETLVKPDYAADFKQLCYDLTVAAIQQNSQLSMLSLVQRPPTGPSRPSRLESIMSRLHLSKPGASTETPSWVPILKPGFNYTVIDGSNLKCCESKESRVEIQGNELSCAGIVVDQVVYATDAFPSIRTSATIEELGLAISKMKTVHDMIQPEKIYPELSAARVLASILCRAPYRSRDVLATSSVLAKRTEELETYLQWSINSKDPQRIDIGNFRAMRKLCSRRKLFKTRKGYWGLGPGYLEEGDRCCILYGARVPYVLRPEGTMKRTYQLIGECYVLGLMNSEALEMLKRGEVKEQVIKIR